VNVCSVDGRHRPIQVFNNCSLCQQLCPLRLLVFSRSLKEMNVFWILFALLSAFITNLCLHPPEISFWIQPHSDYVIGLESIVHTNIFLLQSAEQTSGVSTVKSHEIHYFFTYREIRKYCFFICPVLTRVLCMVCVAANRKCSHRVRESDALFSLTRINCEWLCVKKLEDIEGLFVHIYAVVDSFARLNTSLCSSKAILNHLFYRLARKSSFLRKLHKSL